jgi:urea transporter
MLLLPLIYASATFNLAHSLLLPLSYACATFNLVRADVAEITSYLEGTSFELITIALANCFTLNPKPLNPELIGTYYCVHVIIFLDVAKFFANV